MVLIFCFLRQFCTEMFDFAFTCESDFWPSLLSSIFHKGNIS